MSENQNIINELEKIMHWKQTINFYAERFNVSQETIKEALKQIRSKKTKENTNEEIVFKFFEDIVNGQGEITFNSPNEIRSLEELIEKCKIDTNKWEITKYIQNYWGNEECPRWQVKAWMAIKKEEKVFQDTFTEFLKDYKPSNNFNIKVSKDNRKQNGCLIINKQDSHLNREDVNGNNDIQERFDVLSEKVDIILKQASLSNNIETIKYIIGSDEFNSEWTNTTTKFTPQVNILDYHTSFEKICTHEIQMIRNLLKYTENLDVIFVAGNHDEYVGWHLISWLKTYFRTSSNITFDISPKYRKYISYGSTAMMFNHGDSIKPEKLAGIFPIEYKDDWSYHNNFYIFTGDKHHELSKDFNGIKFYQIPAFTNTKSKWEDKQGYVGARGEVTAFLIDVNDGMTNILKQYL